MATTVQQLVSALIDKIYPVGVIIGFTQDIDPNKQIGGGWRQIKDCFLYASGAKSLGTTGGEETHVLTVSEMPTHSHEMNVYAMCISVGANTGRFDFNSSSNGYVDSYEQVKGNGQTNASGSTGGGAAHNNMPPYRVINYWERIS